MTHMNQCVGEVSFSTGDATTTKVPDLSDLWKLEMISITGPSYVCDSDKALKQFNDSKFIMLNLTMLEEL